MSRLFCLFGMMGVACLLGAGCFQESTPQHSSFLPLNEYPAKFQTVRFCRPSVQHDNRYLKVLSNLGDPYTTPPPAGTVVVAEEHGDSNCSSLIDFKVMAKENAGYDSAAGDWHWQVLDNNQDIIKGQDGHLTTCSSCHAKQPPCNGDYLCSP